MRSLLLPGAFVLALALYGCSSGSRLDTSSDDAIDRSLEKMNAELPNDEKRQELARSIAVLTMPQTTQTGITTALTPDSAMISRTEVFGPLSGKTADQIIAEARPTLSKMQAANR